MGGFGGSWADKSKAGVPLSSKTREGLVSKEKRGISRVTLQKMLHVEHAVKGTEQYVE